MGGSTERIQRLFRVELFSSRDEWQSSETCLSQPAYGKPHVFAILNQGFQAISLAAGKPEGVKRTIVRLRMKHTQASGSEIGHLAVWTCRLAAIR